MNKRVIIASAIAAAVAGTALVAQAAPAPEPYVQGREVLRHSEGRQERLRLDRQ